MCFNVNIIETPTELRNQTHERVLSTLPQLYT